MRASLRGCNLSLWTCCLTLHRPTLKPAITSISMMPSSKTSIIRTRASGPHISGVLWALTRWHKYKVTSVPQRPQHPRRHPPLTPVLWCWRTIPGLSPCPASLQPTASLLRGFSLPRRARHFSLDSNWQQWPFIFCLPPTLFLPTSLLAQESFPLPWSYVAEGRAPSCSFIPALLQSLSSSDLMQLVGNSSRSCFTVCFSGLKK